MFQKLATLKKIPKYLKLRPPFLLEEGALPSNSKPGNTRKLTSNIAATRLLRNGRATPTFNMMGNLLHGMFLSTRMALVTRKLSMQSLGLAHHLT